MRKLPFMQQGVPIAVKNLFEQTVSDLSETVPLTPKKLALKTGFPLPDPIKTLASTKNDLLARAETTRPDQTLGLELLTDSLARPLIQNFNRLVQKASTRFLDDSGTWYKKSAKTSFPDLAESLTACQQLLEDFAFGNSVDVPLELALLTTLTQDALSKDLPDIAEAVLASAKATGLEGDLRSSLLAISSDLVPLGNMNSIHFLSKTVNKNTLLPKSRMLIGDTLANTSTSFFDQRSSHKPEALLTTIQEINPDWLKGSWSDTSDASLPARAPVGVRAHLLAETSNPNRPVWAASLEQRSFQGGSWLKG